MAQFSRPAADVTDGSWLNELGSNGNLYQSIDETSASDSDYITSESAPSSSAVVVKLSTVEDPVSSSGHTLRYRYRKSTTGGAQINLTVELREGYTNEGNPGTLIASDSLVDISTITTGSLNLTSGEADSITDYSDLYLRFVATQV